MVVWIGGGGYRICDPYRDMGHESYEIRGSQFFALVCLTLLQSGGLPYHLFLIVPGVYERYSEITFFKSFYSIQIYDQI